MFTQFKSREEFEKSDRNEMPLFLSDDFRAYAEIELSYDGCYHRLSAKELIHFVRLKNEIEFQTDGFMECNITELELHAKDFTTKFRTLVEVLGFKLKK